MEQSELRVDVIDLTRLAQIKVLSYIHTYIHILFNNAGLKMAAEADVDLLTIDDWNLSL